MQISYYYNPATMVSRIWHQNVPDFDKFYTTKIPMDLVDPVLADGARTVVFSSGGIQKQILVIKPEDFVFGKPAVQPIDLTKQEDQKELFNVLLARKGANGSQLNHIWALSDALAKKKKVWLNLEALRWQIHLANHPDSGRFNVFLRNVFDWNFSNWPNSFKQAQEWCKPMDLFEVHAVGKASEARFQIGDQTLLASQLTMAKIRRNFSKLQPYPGWLLQVEDE